MATMLSMQIRCGVCLNALREPVCLPCEHSYCRVCIARQLAGSADTSTCPECRSPFSRADIRVNRALRNIVDAARAHLEEHEALREQARSILRGHNSLDQCPDHFGTFSHFCETDQQLICVACRGDQRHQGHRFKSLSDALQDNKVKAAEKFEMLVSENETLVELIERQADEIIKTREKSRALSDQISEQFKQMRRFLKDKEEEVKALLLVEEDTRLEAMEVNLFTMEETLSEGRVKQGLLISTLETDHPCQFLQWWSESGRSLIGGVASSVDMRPSLEKVIRDSLSLGPYETDLKVTVCNDMLRSIQAGFPVSSALRLDGV